MDNALAARLEEYLCESVQGAIDCISDRPLAVIDLDACADDMNIVTMPPFPVIGIGNRSHALADRLDVVIEPPISVEQVIQQIERAPKAAAVTVQLLRALENLPCERALMIESLAYGLLQGSAEYGAWLQKHRASPSLHPGKVRVERSDSVLHVVLDRPAARNAIDREMRDGLYEAFAVAASDPTIKAVKLRAVGKVFSAGGDLTEFGTTLDPSTAHLIRSRTLPATALARRADVLDVHIQGACVGAGLEIAAFASRVTAAADASFQLPELSMGLLPGAGGCVSVSRRIGRQRAALMMLSGQRIDAQTALRWKLIDAIKDEPALDEDGSHVS